MKFNYRMEIEDVIYFNEYYTTQRPDIKRWNLIRWPMACFFLLLSLCYAWITYLIITSTQRSGNISIFAGTVFTMIFFFFFFYYGFLWPRIFRKRLRRLVGIMNRGRKSSLLFGEAQMEWDEEYLYSRRGKSEGKHPWEYIEKVESTLDYLFIYIAPSQAYVIHRAKLEKPEEFDTIVAEAKRLCQQAETRFPTGAKNTRAN